MTISVGVRRTALLLHTLQPADRASMLALFDADQEHILNGLLQELAEIGIPRDKALLDDTMENLQVSETSSLKKSMTGDAVIMYLQRAQASQMVELFKDEPPELIARVLACHDWPWSSALLERFEPLKRRQVQSLAHSLQQPAPRLTEILLKSVATGLHALPATTLHGKGSPASINKHHFGKLANLWRQLSTRVGIVPRARSGRMSGDRQS